MWAIKRLDHSDRPRILPFQYSGRFRADFEQRPATGFHLDTLQFRHQIQMQGRIDIRGLDA